MKSANMKAYYTLFFLLIGFVCVILGSVQTSEAGRIPFFLKVEGYPFDKNKLPQPSIEDVKEGNIYRFSKIKIVFQAIRGESITERMDLFYQERSVKNFSVFNWLLVGTIQEEFWLKIKAIQGYTNIHIISDEHSQPKNLFEADVKFYASLPDTSGISKRVILLGTATPPKPDFIEIPVCKIIQESNKKILEVTLPNKKNVRFFPVEPGIFYFGSSRAEIEEGFKKIKVPLDYEGPQKKQEVKKRYWISEFELTIGDFFSFLKNNRSFKDSLINGNTNEWQKYWGKFYKRFASSQTQEEDFKHPLTKVLKSDVEHFLAWLNLLDWDDEPPSGYKFDLPTEIEWEYAAKGPDERTKMYFPWGNSEKDADKKAVFAMVETQKSQQGPSIVGSKKNGKSWCNAQDMAGNVHELMKNPFFNYKSFSIMKMPALTIAGTERQSVARGGAYNTSLWECRTSSRFKVYPDLRLSNVGARIFFVERNDGN